MKKTNKCIVLLYFKDNVHDFLIFNNRNNCTKYFNSVENLKSLEDKGLTGYKIIFGIIQEEF